MYMYLFTLGGVKSDFHIKKYSCRLIITTCVTSGAGTAYLSGAPEFTPEF